MSEERLKEWEEVDKKIEISKIKRFPWKKMLGESLTARIHRLMNKGHTTDEVYSILVRNPKISVYIDEHPGEAIKVLENLKISVCARRGETNTASKIRKEDANL